jgi:hypothetical protein
MNSTSHKSYTKPTSSNWGRRFIMQPTFGANEGDTMEGAA